MAFACAEMSAPPREAAETALFDMNLLRRFGYVDIHFLSIDR
jgi:hypothetical protein